MKPSPKLSFSTLSCPAWTIHQMIDAAAEHGYAGIDFRGIGEEIDVTKLAAFGEALPATLAMLRERGLSMPCLNTSVTLVSPAPERWQAMLDECQRYATLAGRAGTPFLRVFGGGVPSGMTRDEALNMATRHLRQIVKICRAGNCQPLLETHDDWTTSDQVLELIHEFSPGEAAVLWDTEHPYRKGEAPMDTAQRLKRYIKHTHFKDSVRKENNKNSPRLMGEGELPHATFVEALRAIDYDGWACLEAEKRWHAEGPEPEQSIPQYADYMRRLFAATS